MICKVCGRSINNEEANFCEYCGASFRPGSDNKITEEAMHAQSIYQNTMNNMNGSNGMNGNDPFMKYGSANAESMNGASSTTNGQPGQPGRPGSAGMGFSLFSGSDRPMTFGNWILIYALPFVPMVGLILFLVLLFSWGFGANVAPTKKNWARATLVFIFIMLIMFGVMLSSGYFGDPTQILNNFYGAV